MPSYCSCTQLNKLYNETRIAPKILMSAGAYFPVYAFFDANPIAHLIPNILILS